MAEQSHGPQARRSLLRLAALALLAFGLGGCELVPAPQASLPPPAEQQAAAQPEPQPAEDVRQPAAEPTLPADEERHRVAVLVPLTGPNAGVGQSIANAANLALLDTGGARIRITVYDTAGGAGAAAARALAEGNRLFLGPLLAEDVRAVAPVARSANVPVIAFSNDTSVAGDGVYLMGFTPGQSVSRVVTHAGAAGLERFAAIVPDGIYGRRASDALAEAVRRDEGRLVSVQMFDRGVLGVRSAVTRLNAAGGYDAVLIGDSGRVAVAAAPWLKTGSGASARILGTELWSTQGDLGRTPALRGAWYASPSDTLFNQMRTRYRARYGTNPYRLASLGYDAVLLTLRVARDWRPGRAFPLGALRDREGFPGLDGAFRFGLDGVAERALEVREVTAAGTIVVSPAPRGFD